MRDLIEYVKRKAESGEQTTLNQWQAALQQSEEQQGLETWN